MRTTLTIQDALLRKAMERNLSVGEEALRLTWGRKPRGGRSSGGS